MTTIHYSSHPDKDVGTQAYIKQAEEIHHHPDGTPKYLYHLLPVNTKSKTRITIVCPTHGPWETLINYHISNKSGCISCAGKKQLTTEEWVARVQLVHPTYDFSKTVYKGRHHKVTYVCPTHGEQEAYAKDLMKGHRCLLCSRENKHDRGSKTDVHLRIEQVVGTKYNLSEMYNIHNMNQPFYVYCPEHGRFVTTLHSLLTNRGCPKCNGGAKLGQNEFILMLPKSITDKYDLSRVQYTGMRQDVEVVCPIHGSFMKRAELLAKGQGCQKCAGNAELSQSEFKRRAELIWGTTLDLTGAVYINSKIPVMVRCAEHNFRFRQTPAEIMLGNYGCPTCRRDPSRKARLYIIKCTGNGETFYKVGVTQQSMKQRFSGELMPYDYEILFLYDATSQLAYEYESDFKLAIRDFCAYTPKLLFAGSSSECFSDPYLVTTFFPQFDPVKAAPIDDPDIRTDLGWEPTE